MAAARLSNDLDYEQARLLGGAQSAFALDPSLFFQFLDKGLGPFFRKF